MASRPPPPGHLVKLYFSSDRGLMGAPFGLPPKVTALAAYLELLDGSALPWAVSSSAGTSSPARSRRAALDAGGHLHLGLEFFGGPRTPTNAELVSEAVALCAEAGRPVATPDQAAEILGLAARPV